MAITDILVLKPEFNLETTIEFPTIIEEAEDGSETRDSAVDAGLRDYKLRTQYITEAEMEEIWQFYLARKGAEDDFLIKILTEFKSTDEPIATGDGSTLQFVLQKFPVDTTENHSAELDDIVTVDYVLSNDVINEVSYITFNSAPVLGAAITATYEYFFRMRFAKDELTRELLNYKLLGAGIELREVRWNTYFPIGGLSSSSSSSITLANSTHWYGFHGLTRDTLTENGYLTWDGLSLVNNENIPKFKSMQVTTEMVVTRMIVYLAAAPGIGKKKIFTLYHNDEPTNIRLVIADLEVQGDVNFDVSCANGDYLYMREDRINTVTQTTVQIGFSVITNDPRRFPVLGTGCNPNWSPLLGGYLHGSKNVFDNYNVSGGTDLKFHSLITSNGTLRNLQCRHYAQAPGGPMSVVKKVGDNKFYGLYSEENLLALEMDFLEIEKSNTEGSIEADSGDVFCFIGRNRLQSPQGASIHTASCDFIPDIPKECIFGLTGSVPHDTGQFEYSCIHGFDHFERLSVRLEPFTLMAVPGTLKNFTIQVFNTVIVAGYPLVFTLRKNGIDTDIVITLSNIVNKMTSPLTLEIDVRDRLSIKSHPSAVGPTSSGTFMIGWTFVSSNGGEWPMFNTILNE